MKDPFKRFTVAVTGDFGAARTHEKMKQWIEINGGAWATKIDSTVTHLVCSKEHFTKSVAMVKQARKIKKLKIVSFDWLEDSLMSQSPKREGKYLMKGRTKEAAKADAKKSMARKQNIKRGIKAFEKGVKEFRDEMYSDGYHIYRDSTGFSYDITLARADLTTNQNERYYLKLYETHAAPNMYATYVKYSSPGKSATHVLCPTGSTFEMALSNFQAFFKIKTRKAWEQRLASMQVDDDAFIYTPPPMGLPKGNMPTNPDETYGDVLAGFW